jgi:hypothetical protein
MREEHEFQKIVSMLSQGGITHHMRQTIILSWLMLPTERRTTELLREQLTNQVSSVINELDAEGFFSKDYEW